MHGQSLQLCAQRVFVRKELQLSAQLDLKDGSVAKCADQNCCFVRSGIKAQFCGRSPYTGGEPFYILCCGSFVCFFICFDAFDK